MVKLGFIGEGANEKTILESAQFRAILKSLGLDFVEEAINAEGAGNLLPINIEDEINTLRDKGATHIVILTDQEDAPCITSVKQRVDPTAEHIVIIAVKTVESWFLADAAALSKFAKCNIQCEQPETIAKPFEFIKQKRLQLKGIGVNSKRILCSRIIASGFSIENAASHPNCPSAKYFLDKLKSLAIKTEQQ